VRRKPLVRVGGLATIVSGVLFVGPPLLGYYPHTYDRLPLPDEVTLLIIGLVLIPIGMLGFHALQGQYYGRLGLAGFLIVLTAPLVAVAWPVGPLALSVGLALYGMTTLQAKVLPRWCGVLFIVALPVALASSNPLPFISIFIVFGLAWLTLGVVLLTQRVSSNELIFRMD
jgi:hypothetical protein